MKKCMKCGHDGSTMNGEYCNAGVKMHDMGIVCGCQCVWELDFRNERDGNLGEVIDRRVQVYGKPEETYPRIAQIWSGILGIEVNATDVCLCIMGLKMVRAHEMPDYSDNTDDIEGYLDIFRKIVGEDMIHARSVSEFIEQKWGGPNNAAAWTAGQQ